jgi:glycosyltransferase involved in cell wall biosynthesis
MRGLVRLGHEVEAVTLPGSALMSRCREEGIQVYENRMRSDIDLPAAMRLAGRVKRIPCDILHAQTARAHSIALLARLLGARARLVVSRRLDFPVKRDPANRWKYRSRLVDRYVAVADVIREILIDAGVAPRRITVINSTIDLSRFSAPPGTRDEIRHELGIPIDATVVGNVAALAWHKGQKDLIAAMPHVVKVLPGTLCVIVGGGDKREALERQAASLGDSARILFTGRREDIPRLLTAFDLFCMPSYFEGLCNSVLEAFAMRLPVVATRAGGLPEIVTHGGTGLLAPAHDPEALAAAIVHMLSDAPFARKVAEAGHRLVNERFGVEHMVARTVGLYEELINHPPLQTA